RRHPAPRCGMTVAVAGSAVRTCLGDGDRTFTALLEGRCGVGGLRYVDTSRLNVTCGYHIDDEGVEVPLRPSRWLRECVGEALERARIDPARDRVAALVGTGLRELRLVECAGRWRSTPAE